MSGHLAAAAALLLTVLIAAYLANPALNSTHRGITPAGAGFFHGSSNGSSGSSRDILVLYIFSATDDEFFDNLRFFIREAVRGDSRCDYVFVVQHDPPDGHLDEVLHLPVLPPHARYVHHTNECYDWGTFGWLLKSGHVHTRQYKYFFFINCSVRGPYLPPYARGLIHWTQPFLSRLQGDVKLVGPTISCEGSPLDGKIQGRWRHNPHVQSFAVATDRVGLKVLLNAPGVFRCHSSRWGAIYHSELGSSAALLAAGYNIDCFMARYQGVDWRERSNWECNGGMSPQGEHMSDGLTLSPFEVMFIKLKSYSIMNGVTSAAAATKYQQWMHPEPDGEGSGGEAEAEGQGTTDAGGGGQAHTCSSGSGESAAAQSPGGCGAAASPPAPAPGPAREGAVSQGPGGGAAAAACSRGPASRAADREVVSNEYLSDVPRFKVPKVLEAKARGPACFDFELYVSRNPDLRRSGVAVRTAALWKHYVYFGQFESRQYNFTCPFDYESFMEEAEVEQHADPAVAPTPNVQPPAGPAAASPP